MRDCQGIGLLVHTCLCSLIPAPHEPSRYTLRRTLADTEVLGFALSSSALGWCVVRVEGIPIDPICGLRDAPLIYGHSYPLDYCYFSTSHNTDYVQSALRSAAHGLVRTTQGIAWVSLRVRLSRFEPSSLGT